MKQLKYNNSWNKEYYTSYGTNLAYKYQCNLAFYVRTGKLLNLPLLNFLVLTLFLLVLECVALGMDLTTCLNQDCLLLSIGMPLWNKEYYKNYLYVNAQIIDQVQRYSLEGLQILSR